MSENQPEGNSPPSYAPKSPDFSSFSPSDTNKKLPQIPPPLTLDTSDASNKRNSTGSSYHPPASAPVHRHHPYQHPAQHERQEAYVPPRSTSFGSRPPSYGGYPTTPTTAPPPAEQSHYPIPQHAPNAPYSAAPSGYPTASYSQPYPSPQSAYHGPPEPPPGPIHAYPQPRHSHHGPSEPPSAHTHAYPQPRPLHHDPSELPTGQVHAYPSAVSHPEPPTGLIHEYSSQGFPMSTRRQAAAAALAQNQQLAHNERAEDQFEVAHEPFRAPDEDFELKTEPQDDEHMETVGPKSKIEAGEVRTKFPTARIKRIMQADEEVGKVAQQTPIAVGKALELFMMNLVTKSADIAQDKGSKRVTANMLKQVVEADDQWDFLREIVGKVEAEKEGKGKAKVESESEEESFAPKKKAARGRKKKGAE